ncbi:LysM peptidoglycan-binding domain-containing protein [Hyphococcus sp.]|uniref:LysM peptidoglycan-binding domain-containing protein n=1 Tax=Hyphococcus sp. TaxID=2038636 RepID=UPI003CCBE53E
MACSNRTLRILKSAGAVSLMALTATACASNDRRYYSAYENDRYADYNYPATAQTSSYNRTDYYDGRRVDGRYGVDAARAAHARNNERRAERLDGNCEEFVYIHRGETLSDIAEYCDVPVAAIIRANHDIRNPRTVAAGERLRIPNVRGNVYEGSSRYRYAYRDALYADASYQEDYVAAQWIDSRDGRDLYTIRRGDTLAEIAWRFDVPLRTLFQLNPGVRPRQLQVGQHIYLPDYASTSPRQRAHRDYVYYEDEPPLISITPARGPRDGEIRVLGDNFRRGEKVTVYFGDGRNNLTELKIVETDGDGRINEIVRLPNTYDRDEAYFAFRPGNRDNYIMSEAYAIDAGGRRTIARVDGDRTYNQADASRYNNARMRAMQESIYWGDKISLRAEGFPASTPVAIYGGPNRNSLEKLSDIRTGPRGRFSADVEAPESGRGGHVIFVAAIEDGPRTIFSEKVRIIDRDRGYQNSSLSDGYIDDRIYQNEQARTPRRLERGVEGRRGFFDRFRRRDANYVGDARPNAIGGVDSAGSAAIAGVLTDEGENCPALRDDAGNLYTLLGDLEGFDDGDRVLVRGSVQADDRICGQAETIHVHEVDEAPW